MNTKPRKRTLILDTNIISYAGNKPSERQDQVIKIFKDLRNDNFDPTIAEFTRFEILKQAKDNEDQLLLILKLFGVITISPEVAGLAGLLHGFYKKHKITGNFDDGDLFIASPSILTNSYILTGDKYHFCHPYFEEVNFYTITYREHKNSTRSNVLGIYLLKPNIEMVKQEIKEFYKVKSKPKGQ